MRKWLAAVFVVLLAGAPPALAQQSGTITGKVTSADGDALPGVSVSATSSVLPQPRQTVSSATGEYRLPLLPPGTYEVTFTLEGMATERRSVLVALQQVATIDVALSGAVEEVCRGALADSWVRAQR